MVSLTPSAPGESVVTRIRTASPKLSPAQRRIADAIAADPQLVAFGTVADVAKEAQTSGASVVRLATRLGYDGFIELQEAVQGELADRLRPAAARIRDLPPGDVVARALATSTAAVEDTLAGLDRAAFEDAVDYINERRQSGRRIVEFQGIQFMLADLASELALCESFLWRLAAQVDSGATDFGIEASLLKMRASDLAMRITTDAVQLLGGYGYCKDYRVERLMRDAKITQIWEGTNQIHRQLIGRSFLRK